MISFFSGARAVLEALREARAIRLALKKFSRPALAVDLASVGELQFVRPVIECFLARHPDYPLLIVHQRDTRAAVGELMPDLDPRVLHVSRRALDLLAVPEIGCFITSEQYDLGLDGVYSIAMFHGHAAKGLSFVPDVIATFDGLFLLGPIHKIAYEYYLADFPQAGQAACPELFEIGYPKSDALLSGRLSAATWQSLKRYVPGRKTILYAPAFNEGASLRESGLEVIRRLAENPDWNVVAKLPIDCSEPLSNTYATGGVDWAGALAGFEARYANFEIARGLEIDPLLQVSDVLVTCISSVSFEFLALGKPVVFIETPRYYSGWLARRFPDLDLTSWPERITVNGGKRFGPVVSDIAQLPGAVADVLAQPRRYPLEPEWLADNLVYHRGEAGEHAADALERLLASRVRTRRQSRRLQRALRALLVGSARRLLPARWHGAVKALFRSPGPSIRGAERRFWNAVLRRRGYVVRPIGEGYIDCRQVVAAAARAGLSVCDYLEGRESDRRKRGRRDRIVAAMLAAGALAEARSVVEIGAGTGMYAEKLLVTGQVRRYEIYETDRAWRGYLRQRFGQGGVTEVVVHDPDGETLAGTADASARFVHAHGVFVYIPILAFVSYFREVGRVLAPGGLFIFDCYLVSSFSGAVASAWLRSDWRFPVVIADSLIDELAVEVGFEACGRFREVHAIAEVDYLIFRKS